MPAFFCGITRHPSRGRAEFSVPPLPRLRYSSAFRPGSFGPKIRATRGNLLLGQDERRNRSGMNSGQIVLPEGRRVKRNSCFWKMEQSRARLYVTQSTGKTFDAGSGLLAFLNLLVLGVHVLG